MASQARSPWRGGVSSRNRGRWTLPGWIGKLVTTPCGAPLTSAGASIADRPGPTGIGARAARDDGGPAARSIEPSGLGGANDTEPSRSVSMRASRSGRRIGPWWRYRLTCRLAARGSALVLEADLDLDPVLDDLAILDDGARLHDFDRLDVADCLRRGRHCLPRGVAPRSRASPDHLPNDDDAHRSTSISCSCRPSLRPAARALNRRADPPQVGS